MAVMNFTAREVPYTRVIEHKHFVYGTQPVTYVTREYPADWQRGDEAYYPVNDEQNQALYLTWEVDIKYTVLFDGYEVSLLQYGSGHCSSFAKGWAGNGIGY